MPGKVFMQFCKGPLLTFGAFLDKQIIKITGSFIANIRNPNIELRLTPMAIGFGVFMSVVLFTVFLVLKI
jgi:hypothetical protein